MFMFDDDNSNTYAFQSNSKAFEFKVKQRNILNKI